MSDSVDRVFVHALNTVKKIPRTGSARPPPADRLKLYGLYKQSMEGDVEGVMDRPVGDGADVQAECEKWDAWYAQRGLSRTEAKRRYITTLIETMHRYASHSPEARELISELEFVWDQIKSNNPSSSSSSSPVQPVSMPIVPQQLQTQPSYGSISGLLAGSGGGSRGGDDDMVVRGGSRLRVLSPVSHPEEMYQRRHSAADEDEDEEEEDEEEYQEARDELYDDDDEENHNNDNHHIADAEEEEHALRRNRRTADRGGNNNDIHNRKWRRRVEQALTKMTAEIAAMREQMEARALYNRRRSSMLAWLKWLVWVAMRQILWDLTLLAIILIWMRLRGDRRPEQWLKAGLMELKDRLVRLRLWRRLRRSPLLP
ncbi:hypothetical protein VTN00DRAFT_9683 [Thermoascus crustaceus]|uniref:uncharacterized protein n=1 Tax=Thermoascus crustaceus TaxID=5088 RepID=UPI003743A7FD